MRPLHYFGEDLVAYRDESGELHVMEAHCKHLGAHIGHGGKVVGDCVECPFHGWRWGPDGTNRYIPYQPDRPNRGLTLRVYPVHRAVRLRVRLASARTARNRSGRCRTSSRRSRSSRPTRRRTTGRIRSSPGAPSMNPCTRRSSPRTAPTAAHFQYVHGATVTPVCLRLGDRRPGVAVPHRLARCPQRRSGQDGACGSTATCSASAARSACSKDRRTTG